MKKVIVLLLCLTQSILMATQMESTTQNISLYPLSENTIQIKSSYNRINEEIDFLNIKEQELGGHADFATIGDASGYDFSFGYGINDKIALYYDREYLSIHYTDTKLNNTKHDIYSKINLYHNEASFLQRLSLDIGYVYNSANDLDIKQLTTLNSMVQKILPGTNISFNEEGIVYNNNTLQIFNPDGTPLIPFVKITDLHDDTFYLRLITGRTYENSTVKFYGGIKRTSINSLITLEPSDNFLIAAVLDQFGELDLKRDENTLFAGLNFMHQYKNYLFEAGYEYLKIFGRDAALDATDDNHIFTGAISTQVTKDFSLFIGGKAMLHQFNGILPYLYNEYSKTQFDKKYGYAKVGFIYNFDLNSL